MTTENLKKHVRFLTEIQPSRNYQNIRSLNRVAEYIHSSLSETLPDSTSYQDFEVQGDIYKNVIGILTGESEKRIIIGAHYDVHGNFPGADDNASAVAGLIETAKILKEKLKNKKNKYTIEFVAYSLEEQPHRGIDLTINGRDGMGSYVHAKSLNEKNIPVNYMVSYEMIGYFSSLPNSQRFPAHPYFQQFNTIGDFIAIAGFSSQKDFVNEFFHQYSSKCKLRTECIAETFTDPTAGRSDHRNYYETFGYNALMITDTAEYRNPNYHRSTDTFDTLDFESLEKVINGMVECLMDTF
jgi:Zn-dependent M28 family amino/carboxypeptidase